MARHPHKWIVGLLAGTLTIGIGGVWNIRQTQARENSGNSSTTGKSSMESENNAQQQQQQRKVGYDDTPFLPGDKWRVHDSKRPMPVVVTPPTNSTQDAPGKAPSDAIVLFDGKDLSRWKKAGGDAAAGWMVKDGYMQVPSGDAPGRGDIQTRDEFGDCQVHIEWMAPDPARGVDQGRGNSGVFLMGRYEIQVLDTYQNQTYADGHAGAIYGQYPPLVNASRKPGEWQSYDILWTAPRFKDGKLERPAYMTLLHNGVVVQNHTELIGNTPHRAVGTYSPHPATGPLRLQDHGDPVRFRNIWVRPIKAHDEQ